MFWHVKCLGKILCCLIYSDVLMSVLTAMISLRNKITNVVV